MTSLSSYETFPITITKTQTDGLPLNKVIQRFANSIAFPNGTKIGLQNLSIYYSWQNISSLNNNNSLSYIYNGTTYPVVYPDGSYSIDDINGYLHFVMKANGHYLLDSTGEEVYFISLTENIVYDRFLFQCLVVPSVLGTYTNPAGMTLTGETMSIVIPSTDIRYLLGFEATTFPAAPETSLQQKLSDNIPQISPVVQVQLRSSLVNNSQFNPNNSNVLYSFTPNKAYGENLALEPTNIVYSPVHNLSFSQIDITFTSQTGADLNILDYNYSLTLILLIPKK